MVLPSIAEIPDWIRDFSVAQRYPPSQYLAAISVVSGNDEEASETAKNNARVEISSIIVVNVRSLISSVREEKNSKYSQYLSSISQCSTSIRLMGLRVEIYVDNSKKAPKTYAVAYVSKDELIRIYSKRKTELIDQIKKITEDAKSEEASLKNNDAVVKYLSLYPLYEQLKEASVILLVVNRRNSMEDIFDELDRLTDDRPSDTGEEDIMSQIEVSSKIDRLLSQSIYSISDVARIVTFRILKQIGELKKQVWIGIPAYQDTGMIGSFARYFKSELENQIVQMANWKIAGQARSLPSETQYLQDLRYAAMAYGAEWYIYGTYWEQKDEVKLILIVRDVDTNKVLAGTDVIFNSEILPKDLALKPPNYESVYIAQQAFAETQFISDQIHLDIWTDKGKENIIYSAGEVMKVYIRVNQECYIRLLYILADGRWALLYDDYYINQPRANQVIEIPGRFNCVPPFGSEVLVAIAKVQAFEKLYTIKENGYEIIPKDGEILSLQDARSLADKVRGRGEMNQDTKQAESSLVITTMPE